MSLKDVPAKNAIPKLSTKDVKKTTTGLFCIYIYSYIETRSAISAILASFNLDAP